ncbi:hypothetical protein UVI_02031570 [Ustilaginoidea virens]|uniref:Myb-like domain-containing protein n=1 Tax=Ustilaginoidea virens TaxID=1159556 RepID=A0A1B5KU74_USTVR|nr:hypothetical protein UVI_02031570 [Ustilaginoidea virens]
MLLPSAPLSCDSAQPLRPAAQQPSNYFSPPSSPPTLSSARALSNIMTTCRSLQSLIAAPACSSSLPVAPIAPVDPVAPGRLPQLPTPPLAHAPLPMKLRLRTRPGTPADSTSSSGDDLYTRRRLAKRCAPPPGLHKRRRDAGDQMGRQDVLWPSKDQDQDQDQDDGAAQDEDGAHEENGKTANGGEDGQSPVEAEAEAEAELEPAAPSTPKRARLAPERLPLGLERSDFHRVHSQAHDQAHSQAAGGGQGRGSLGGGSDVEVEADGAEWSAEDDRILVELVLEKLRLSKLEWQDCARNLGKDRRSVHRRWKSLVVKGEVGLKARSSNRRNRLLSTWR